MSIRGEWWIVDGQPLYADGDIGDMNHEAYALQVILQEVASAIGMEWDSECADTVAFTVEYAMFADDLSRDSGVSVDDLYDQHKQALVNVLEDAERANFAWDCIFGYASDPRVYAVKYFGWIRVHGNHIQLWTCTSETLRHLGDGLCEIASEEEDVEQEEFFLSVCASERCYESVPGSIILSSNPQGLLRYCTTPMSV